MLQINALTKNFRGVRALNNVTFQMDQRIVVAFVGDNGAGKSTLMKCVSGALTPDSGTIQFDSLDISRADPGICRDAGIEMIYQDLSLCRLQNVATNVFLGRELKNGMFLDKKLMEARCEEVFNELGVKISSRKSVGALSGGQQQSVAIARAMIAKPKLLIMDEPTAALSAKEVVSVLGQITALRTTGVAVAIITHRLADVFEVADRIIVMSQGEIKHDLATTETDLKDLTSRIIGA